MWALIKNIYKCYFADPDGVLLLLMIAISIFLAMVFGGMLAPLLISVIIAYLLDWVVTFLHRLYMPRTLAVYIVYLIFIGLLFLAIIGLMPVLWRQLSSMIQDLPHTLGKGQELLMKLPNKYPTIITVDQIKHFIVDIKSYMGEAGQRILSFSLSSISSVIEVVVYLILVPLFVFFFLKDKEALLKYVGRFMPSQRLIIRNIWGEIKIQIGNYVRGRVVEIIIVTVVCVVTFSLMGLHYTLLLSVLVGLSVIVPYVGAIVVTVPVAVVAFLQWGWHPHFAYLMIAYAIIITLDANILVPLLFSGAVNLHPVSIIVAVLVFGGIWGFWGVFLAIPLAALLKAVVDTYPVHFKRQAP